ncbi:MAG TPA: glycogen debranching protein GlgX [Anaerolineae bacterium]|nr:glycogen debranching protein GlgX [Anaerolineae bacterium]
MPTKQKVLKKDAVLVNNKPKTNGTNGTKHIEDSAIEPKIHIIAPGSPHPLGATPDKNGVNFSLYSEHATGVQLLLFANSQATEPFQVIDLDPSVNTSFHFWHVYVKDLKPGTLYAYRVDGPRNVKEGHRFDPDKVLIDPYAKGNDQTLWDRGKACVPGDNVATSMRSVVIDSSDYDWGSDKALKRPMSETIIYEMHVGGFTKSPTSGVKHPGTFLGVVEKIPYLKELGVTAVELLPVFEFDSTDVMREVDGRPLKNYWGYSTMSYFSPHSAFSTGQTEWDDVKEFRDMVKALHEAGIEVILDVVFNHTDEGNHQGPNFCFKGIDNATYYYLVPDDKQFYYDYTGCGNTFNCNHPIGEKFIWECLKYWVEEMHVDGFRFDEGSVLSRGLDGAPMQYPPVLWHIELDEALMETKVIAEAWDAAGLYQIGYFPGNRWGEWNGKYRDAIRKFVKGDAGIIGEVARRIAGSADLYQWQGEAPTNSINFITAHDGFTLHDLVSYNDKHNEANGEGNNDGVNDNDSWNCGAEGETDDSEINALREQQIKNFAAILLLSQGVPMIVMGDEVRRTQGGNNNAYCHDNEISWMDWQRVEENSDMFRFWKWMIDFRKRHPAIHRARYFTGAVNERNLQDIAWHGVKLDEPDWGGAARVLAFTLAGFEQDADIHVMMNMYWQGLNFELPTVKGRTWYRAVDTFQSSPNDITEPGQEIAIDGNTYLVQPRSVVVLISK